MRRKHKLKYFLQIYLTRAIIPAIIAMIFLSIQDQSFKIAYYGLGNIALILLLSVFLFLPINIFVYGIEGYILPSLNDGLISILILLICSCIVFFRSYVIGHLFDVLPMLLFFVSSATIAVTIERGLSLRDTRY